MGTPTLITGTPIRWHHPSGHVYTGTVLDDSWIKDRKTGQGRRSLCMYNDEYPDQDTRRTLFVGDISQIEVVQ